MCDSIGPLQKNESQRNCYPHLSTTSCVKRRNRNSDGSIRVEALFNFRCTKVSIDSGKAVKGCVLLLTEAVECYRRA